MAALAAPIARGLAPVGGRNRIGMNVCGRPILRFSLGFAMLRFTFSLPVLALPKTKIREIGMPWITFALT